MNKEGCGRSAHDWSSHQRVGSLSRIGLKLKAKEPYQRVISDDLMIKSSAFYPQIQERYESFSYENLTLLNYTNAIINFNPTIINSKIKSDYILFEEKANGEYNHLCIAEDETKRIRYIETFFHESTDKYLAGQTIVKIKKFKLLDQNNQIIVEDSF